jgi:succinyl-CoA synthetase beta subunit
MDGSKVEEGKELLANSGLNVQTADFLGEGAERIVAMLKDAEAAEESE